MLQVKNYKSQRQKLISLKKTFTYSEPKVWNELPFMLRQASSHNAFKTKVKSLILNDGVP
jgi:hypothetical protein